VCYTHACSSHRISAASDVDDDDDDDDDEDDDNGCQRKSLRFSA